MSFFKNLFYGKPQPDNAMTVYLDELKQMSEGMVALRVQFAKYGRSVQVLSNSGLELAHSIRQFSLGLKLQNPPIQEFSHSAVHFREDVFKVWSQQFVDEVLIMFDHWDRQADAQRTTISNYHIARDHCFVLKNELQELLEKKTQLTHSKTPLSTEFQSQLFKHEEEYKKYSVALETIRSRIVSNQNKLLGKNGQLQDFSRAFYALLESQINFGAYFKSLTDSYVPILDTYRKELGISQHTHPAQNGQLGVNGALLPGNAQFSFTDDITVLDIASFIRETASLEGDRTTITNIDSLLTTFDQASQQTTPHSGPGTAAPATATDTTNPNTPTTTSNLSLQVGSDSPALGPRRSSLAPQSTAPASPSHHADNNPPALTFALSTRKKRHTMVPSGPMSPSDASPQAEFTIAGHPTTKKASSRATFTAGSVPSFNLDADEHDPNALSPHNNMFLQQHLEKKNQSQNSQNTEDSLDLENPDAALEPQIVCAFSNALNDQDDDEDTFGFSFAQSAQNTATGNDLQGNSEQPIFQSILAKLVDEETDLIADHHVPTNSSPGSTQQLSSSSTNYSVIPSQFTLDDFSLLAQKWSLSSLNQQQHTKEHITSLLQTLNTLCTKYIADWVIVEIELQLWEKSPSLHLLLCTLNTLTICKTIQQHQGLPGQAQLTTTVAIDHPLSSGTAQMTQQQPVQYGFTFRTASKDSAFSYFYYVYNVFTALFHQLFGDNEADMLKNLSYLVDAFEHGKPTPKQHVENVQRLVQTTQILRLLIILCDKCLLQIHQTNYNAARKNILSGHQNQGDDDDDDDDLEEIDEDEEYDEDDDEEEEYDEDNE